MGTINRLSLPLAISLISLSIIFSTSCAKDNDVPTEVVEVELTVASKKVMSEDWGGVKLERYVVKEEGGYWQILFSLMPDFEYEDGHEYRLKVRKIVPPPDLMDAYTSYELISQLSKEKKETIFQSISYGVTNHAKAKGSKLTVDEIAAIESKIKQSSSFTGVTSLTLEYRDFYVGALSKRDFTYRTNTGMSGNGHIAVEEDKGREGSIYTFYTFDFNGKEVKYDYLGAGSPTSSRYLILDLTSEYKTDYPNLDVAESGIEIRPML